MYYDIQSCLPTTVIMNLEAQTPGLHHLGQWQEHPHQEELALVKTCY